MCMWQYDNNRLFGLETTFLCHISLAFMSHLERMITEVFDVTDIIHDFVSAKARKSFFPEINHKILKIIHAFINLPFQELVFKYSATYNKYFNNTFLSFGFMLKNK